MWYYAVVALCMALAVDCDIRTSTGLVGDSPQARGLFLLADKDGDGRLTHAELHEVFLTFDRNNDSAVSSTEFFLTWQETKLGPDQEAITLFFNLDVDRDLKITETADMPLIFHFFDRNSDNEVSEAEFVMQWVKISS